MQEVYKYVYSKAEGSVPNDDEASPHHQLATLAAACPRISGRSGTHHMHYKVLRCKGVAPLPVQRR